MKRHFQYLTTSLLASCFILALADSIKNGNPFIYMFFMMGFALSIPYLAGIIVLDSLYKILANNWGNSILLGLIMIISGVLVALLFYLIFHGIDIAFFNSDQPFAIASHIWSNIMLILVSGIIPPLTIVFYNWLESDG